MTSKHILSLLYVLACCLSTNLMPYPITEAAPPAPTAVPQGKVAGHVWLDQNCDGRKDVGEGNVALAGIIQLVNTGRDRVLNPGDGAQTYYTDAQGNWQSGQISVNDFLDGQPWVFAVAVGAGSAADLGYRPSPEGGDSILHGPTYASDTFQLQDGQTLQIGQIGVCPLVGRILIPSVAKK